MQSKIAQPLFCFSCSFCTLAPFLYFLHCRASRPATRRPLLKKGGDPKTFLRVGNILFMEGRRIRNAGSVDFREPIYGYREPSPLWCFVLSCMVGGILRKPLGFRRCLPPARPEKAKPFQAGRSPCTKHRQIVRLRLHALKKVFEGSKGRFFKNAPWQGVGRSPTKREQASPSGHAFSGGTNARIGKGLLQLNFAPVLFQ